MAVDGVIEAGRGRPVVAGEPTVGCVGWLTRETMSQLGRELMEIADQIESSDETPMDEEAVERELIRRRGGYSGKGE